MPFLFEIIMQNWQQDLFYLEMMIEERQNVDLAINDH